MQRLFVLPSVDSSFYRVAIRGDEARGSRASKRPKSAAQIFYGLFYGPRIFGP